MLILLKEVLHFRGGMVMRRVLFFIVLIASVLSAFATKLLFWVAPNALQEAFWKSIVAEYKSVRPDVEITVEVIPLPPVPKRQYSQH